MTGKVYFVSGANRGVGFEFAKQLSSNPENTVIGSARDPSKAEELQKIAETQKNVKIVKLDVSDKKSIDALDEQLKDIAKNGIDVLISNAGIAQSYKPALQTDLEVYEKHFKTNTLGPIFLTKVLYKYLKLKDTRHLVYVSSFAGSISGFVPLSSSAYGQSKAALNYSVKEMSFELAAEDFIVVAVHPGMVDTDMGKTATAGYIEQDPKILEAFKEVKLYSAQESVESQLETVIYKLDKEKSGKFFDVDGGELPF